VEWLIFSRRRILLFLAVFLLLGLLYLLLAGVVHLPSAIEPQDLLRQAVTRTKAVKSYSYSIKTRLVTRQGTRNLSDLKGSRVLPDGVSVTGKIFNSPVEIVQLKGVTYVKDRYSAKWLALNGDRLGDTGVFIAELDPLVLLDFKETPLVVWGKKERSEKKELLVLECTPRVANRFLAAQFVDFKYRMYVDPKQHYVTRVKVEARSKESQTRLFIDLGLDNFDKPLKIEPPAKTSTH
jgi:hypothetical protein